MGTGEKSQLFEAERIVGERKLTLLYLWLFLKRHIV